MNAITGIRGFHDAIDINHFVYFILIDGILIMNGCNNQSLVMPDDQILNVPPSELSPNPVPDNRASEASGPALASLHRKRSWTTEAQELDWCGGRQKLLRLKSNGGLWGDTRITPPKPAGPPPHGDESDRDS